MPSFHSSRTDVQPSPAAAGAYSRLQQTTTFRGAGLARWRTATLGVIGAGTLGAPLALEAVRSGVGVCYLWDFDTARVENIGTQIARPGVLKVHSIAQACDEIRPGVLRPLASDIRHIGMRPWLECDVMIDCSDDPALAWTLTEISNGTATPLLRCAVDGSGELEYGRVLCSHGAAHHACQLCSYCVDELRARLSRTPCLGQEAVGIRPTVAGSAIAMVIAGVALLQTQRLVTGNDLDQVLDREIILDLSSGQMHNVQLQRCDHCLSGHQRWEFVELSATADSATLHDLFGALAHSRAANDDVTLSVYQHPLNTQAYCHCGNVQAAVGTEWATPPECQCCGKEMAWLNEMPIDQLNRPTAADLGILYTPLAQLGVPDDGAMLLARSPGRPLQRLLLRDRRQAAKPTVQEKTQ